MSTFSKDLITIYVVYGFDPSDYSKGEIPIKAFYNESDADACAAQLAEKAQQFIEERDKLYAYLDEEFPLVGQESISQRVDFLEQSQALEKLSNSFSEIPPGCTMFGHYSIELE